MVHSYDFQRERKSESYPSLFGRKERLKDMVTMRWLNAFAVVFNFNRHVAVFRFGGQSNGPARGGVFNRVEENVQNRLLNLYRIALQCWHMILKVYFYGQRLFRRLGFGKQFPHL